MAKEAKSRGLEASSNNFRLSPLNLIRYLSVFLAEGKPPSAQFWRKLWSLW